MNKLLFFLLILWPAYYFWHHPEDIHSPSKIIPVTKELVQDALDSLPYMPSLIEKTQPPGVLVPTAPSIYPVVSTTWRFHNSDFIPLFGYHLHARVLSKMHYMMSRESEFAPYDLALGWQDMSDSRVLAQIPVSQSNRWYYYEYPENSPIPPSEIPLESGNMHIIPANDEILHTLRRIVKGNVIDLGGYLVLIQSPDGWSWKSGTSATGEGQGSCKVIWVTALTIEQ